MLKLQLVLLCTVSFLIWIFAGYVSSREWNAEMRVFVPQIFFQGPYFLYWAYIIARFTNANDFYENTYPKFIMVSFAVSLAMCAWGFFFHVPLMHESNGGFWAPTPCGSSSCSADALSTATYNPNGFFKTSEKSYADYMPTTCMYQECTWAGGDARTTVGYAASVSQPGYPDFSKPCDAIALASGECLASNRTVDYPNPAIGIPGGFLNGLGTRVPRPDNTSTLCPGTIYVNGVVQGRAPCSYCVPYFRKHYAAYESQLADVSYCPRAFVNDGTGVARADNYLWCGVVLGTFSYCPQPYEVRTPYVMRRIVIYWYLIATNPIVPILYLGARKSDKSKLL